MCTNISEDISQIRLTCGEMTFDRPVCAPHPLAAQPRLPAGGERRRGGFRILGEGGGEAVVMRYRV